ncbi:MAG TPA: amino acid ABC transporter substrate-binding protein [Caldilineae bacterium]|nr:amino acid ABC transporter substrate-binding protein [Caldilineae bacterium]
MSRRWALPALAVVAIASIVVAWWLFRPRQDAHWRRIIDTGVWRVAIDPSFPPFESTGPDGELIGFDVDLARAIAVRWGVEVRFELIGFDGLLDSVWAGQVDSVISAYPLQPQYARDVGYSIPYFEAGVVLVAREGSGIEGIEDLRGRRVAVEWGSEGDVQARKLARRLGDLSIVPLESPDLAVGAVVDGQADAALVDGVTAALAIGRGDPLMIVGEPLSPAPYVIVTHVRAHALLAAINQALEDLKAEGVLDELRARWFGLGWSRKAQ